MNMIFLPQIKITDSAHTEICQVPPGPCPHSVNGPQYKASQARL